MIAPRRLAVPPTNADATTAPGARGGSDDRPQGRVLLRVLRDRRDPPGVPRGPPVAYPHGQGVGPGGFPHGTHTRGGPRPDLPHQRRRTPWPVIPGAGSSRKGWSAIGTPRGRNPSSRPPRRNGGGRSGRSPVRGPGRTAARSTAGGTASRWPGGPPGPGRGPRTNGNRGGNSGTAGDSSWDPPRDR